jgi:C_GCAxxG_C_C family probable redox protein
MSNAIAAKELHAKGFNCAQAILFTYGKDYFKENTTALKLASPFGAGVTYRGELCGVVSASLMTIGMKYGYSEMTMDPVKELVFQISKEFIEAFEKQNGSIVCSQLLNCEIDSLEKLQIARQNGAFKNCNGYVGNAAEILDSLIDKYSKNKI